MTRLALILCLSALPAMAQDGVPTSPPLTAEEFDAYVTGKTLSYADQNGVWGTEQYLPGRRVIWAFSEDTCQYGTWYPKGEQICFVYDATPDPQCWTFWRGAEGLKALFSGDSATQLSEVRQSDEPLGCPGPDVGV